MIFFASQKFKLNVFEKDIHIVEIASSRQDPIILISELNHDIRILNCTTVSNALQKDHRGVKSKDKSNARLCSFFPSILFS